MEGSTPKAAGVPGSATERAVDPAAFCGIAARMLAAGGRANIPAVLHLLGQALDADVELQEPDPKGLPNASRDSIPQPRLRRTVDLGAGAVTGVAMDLPVRSRGEIVAVLCIEPSPSGIPDGWAGPLGTLADLLALTLAAGGVAPAGPPEPDPRGRAIAEAWFADDERERADLAGHLHDGLVQSLIAARYLLDLAARAQPGDARQWLDALRESLQEALADGRGLLTSLQPRTRHGQGLRLALEEFCASSRFPVSLEAAAPERAPQLSPVDAAAAYRFVQAAVADLAARGAGAAQVGLAYVRGAQAYDLVVDVAAVPGPDGGPVRLADPVPGEALERWARRLHLLGGRIVLDAERAHLSFGPADGEPGAAPPLCPPATARPVSAAPADPRAGAIPTRTSAGRTK